MGVKDRYESFHHVEYSNEAIEAAVYQSSRYITDRFLPDKAIDLIDEAGARAKLREAEASAEMGEISRSIRMAVEQIDQAVSERNVEKAWLYRDQEAAGAREPAASSASGWTCKSGVDARRHRQARNRRSRLEVDRRAADVGQRGRGRQAPADGRGAAPARHQPGEGDLGAVARHPPVARRPQEPDAAGRQLHLPGPDRRRQDRARARARQLPVRQRPRADPLRHVRVHGEALGLEADRLAARLRRPRRGRPAHREDQAQPVLGRAARRDREGAPGSVQHPAAGLRGRPPDRRPRQPGQLQEHDPDHDVEHRRALHPEEGVDGLPDARLAARSRSRSPTWCSAR